MSFVESKPMDDDITSAKPLHGADLQEMSAPRNEVCRRVSLNWRHVSVILVGRFLFSVNHSFLVSCSRAKNESMLKPFFQLADNAKGLAYAGIISSCSNRDAR